MSTSFSERSPLKFLSTPSARRATYDVWEKITPIIFLSTPSARRATRCRHDERVRLAISIHALREEGDHGERWRNLRLSDFYPRPPRGGRHGLL